VAWGDSNLGGTGAPTDSRYTKIYSTDEAFAALKTDGHCRQVHPYLQNRSDPTPWLSQRMEAQVNPLTVTISKFIQLSMPLLPLKPMVQSRRGPPLPERPHAVIEPSALRAAKADLVE
jgi:hypothetical protein